MKRHFFFYGLVMTGMLAVTLLMNSCVTPAYKETIPSNAVAVLEVNTLKLGYKADFIEQKEQLADLLASIDSDDRMLRKTAEALKDPKNAGLSLLKPMYLFALPSSDEQIVFLAAVNNQAKLIKTLTAISNDIDISNAGDIAWIIVDNRVIGAITKKALLIGSMRDKDVYRDLLEQKNSQCFFSSKEGKLMHHHRGDITAMLNMRALSNSVKRDIRRELENELDVYDVDDMLDLLFGTQIIANLKCKSGKITLNLFANGLTEQSAELFNKKIESTELREIPDRNLIGVVAIGVDGKEYWRLADKILSSAKQHMSREERDAYDAVGKFVQSMDGTIVGSVGGKDVINSPEFLCVLPVSKSETRNVINAMGENLPEEIYMEGSSTHTAITNMHNYDFGRVFSSFDKAPNAGSSYLYAYLDAEPVIEATFKEITRYADRDEMKVYNKFRDLCEFADYAELTMKKRNEVALTLYLTDKSQNPLAIILEHGIKIGHVIIDYNNERRDAHRAYRNAPVQETIEEIEIAAAEGVHY